MSDRPEPWVDTATVAAHLGLTVEYLYANAERLGVPRVKIGRRYKFRLSEVDAWLTSATLAA